MSDHDDVLDDLLGQLKDNTAFNNKAIKNNESFNLPKEKLEEYIINTSGRLVQDSLDMIEVVKERVASAAEPDDVASLSELLKASTNAIETLNKVLLQDKRTMTTLTAKTMDIESKKEIAENDNKTRLMASRGEMIEKIIEDAKVIDISAPKEKDL